MVKANKLEDLKILPTITQMAEEIDTAEARKRAKQILAQADYREAHAIIDGARALLAALLSMPAEGDMASDQLTIIACNAKEVGELGSALETVAKHAVVR